MLSGNHGLCLIRWLWSKGEQDGKKPKPTLAHLRCSGKVLLRLGAAYKRLAWLSTSEKLQALGQREAHGASFTDGH